MWSSAGNFWRRLRSRVNPFRYRRISFAGGAPFIHPLFAAAGLAPAAWFFHSLLWVLAPLNVILLLLGARRHHRWKAVVLGAIGSVAILVHLVGHETLGIVLEGTPGRWGNLVLIRGGAVALLISAILEWRYQGNLRVRRMQKEAVEAYWRSALEGSHPGMVRGRRLFGKLPAPPRCKLCNAPFSAPGSLVMRVFGKQPSPMNPNFCDDCLSKTPVGGAEVTVSLLFVDARGSTSIAETMSPSEFTQLMNRLYSVTSKVLIEHDALVDKFVGDEVVAIFAPGYAGSSYARKAVDAAREIMHATGHQEPKGPWLSVGAGIHTGPAFVGVVGADSMITDVTAMGDAVNVAARLASAAEGGEILVSEETIQAASIDVGKYESTEMELKGRSMPLHVYHFTRGRDSQKIP